MRLHYRARGFSFSILIAGGKWKDSLLIRIINSYSVFCALDSYAVGFDVIASFIQIRCRRIKL